LDERSPRVIDPNSEANFKQNEIAAMGGLGPQK
jgi:hypothetical protein